MRHTSRLIRHIVTYIAMQGAAHTTKTQQSQIRRSKALSVSSPYNLPQETQNSLITKEKRLKSNRKVHDDVQKKNKNKKFWKWVGLGCCWRTWGGVGMMHRADAYPTRHGISRHTTLNVHGGVIASNRKENALNRLNLHAKWSYRTRTKKMHVSQKTVRTHAHRAYLNAHITCRHYTPHYNRCTYTPD